MRRSCQSSLLQHSIEMSAVELVIPHYVKDITAECVVGPFDASGFGVDVPRQDYEVIAIGLGAEITELDMEVGQDVGLHKAAPFEVDLGVN